MLAHVEDVKESSEGEGRGRRRTRADGRPRPAKAAIFTRNVRPLLSPPLSLSEVRERERERESVD